MTIITLMVLMYSTIDSGTASQATQRGRHRNRAGRARTDDQTTVRPSPCMTTRPRFMLNSIRNNCPKMMIPIKIFLIKWCPLTPSESVLFVSSIPSSSQIFCVVWREPLYREWLGVTNQQNIVGDWNIWLVFTPSTCISKRWAWRRQ